MRIAMIAACPFPWPRGTPIRIHRMAEALGQRGHDVHVVTYHLGRDEPSSHMTIHRIAGPAAYRRTSPGPSVTKLALLDPLMAVTLRRLLREQAFDVIHAHHYESLLVALVARQRRGPPVVFDSHTLLESELPSYGPAMLTRLAQRAGRMVERNLPRRADRVIAVSEEIRTRLQGIGRIDAARISVIPNGVEFDHFGNGTSARQPEVIAFAGNLARYQRIDLLLQAFAIVLRTRPFARLEILTGDDIGPFDGLMRELCIEKRVDIVDVDYASLPDRLGRATVLANPRTECAGLPQKLLNYMASGTPIVSFAGSGQLLAHEQTGLVVQDDDIRGFAAAVLRLMDDAALGARLGHAARETAVRDHSWDQVAAHVERVYASAMAPPRQ